MSSQPTVPEMARKVRPGIRRCLSMIPQTEESRSNWKESPAFHLKTPTSVFKGLNFNERDENASPSSMSPYNLIAPKRSESLLTPLSSLPTKKRKQVEDKEPDGESKVVAMKSPLQPSLSQASIMNAVQKSDQDPDLIGDFSKPYALPLIPGRHNDLKTISVDTLYALIKGHYKSFVDSYSIIDCRYPYEYNGGHIAMAQNIYTKQKIDETFLKSSPPVDQKLRRHILIFHCEFSSERGPSLYRFLRNTDRQNNKEFYPRLNCPEIYILDGGYKAFFEKYRDLCEPQQYLPMSAKEHKHDLRHFKAKSKSWTCEAKWSAFSARPNLKE